MTPDPDKQVLQEDFDHLCRELEAIRPRFPFLIDIHRNGPVMGLRFDSATTSELMVRALGDNGIPTVAAPLDETVIQFEPGRLVDTAACDDLPRRFEQALVWFVANANNVMMEVSPDAGDVDRAGRFARAALRAWGVEGAPLELVKHRENTVYSVRTDAGRHYALRIHRAGYHSRREIESEIQWMQALAAAGIPTAEPIATAGGAWVAEVGVEGDSETRSASLFAWREGVLFDNLGAVENGMVEELVTRYRQLGRLAGRVHNQSERWQPPAGFTRHSWDENGLLGDEPLWGRFWEHPLMSPSQRRLILKARIALGGLLAQLGKGSDRYGLIHADFLPENILSHEGELCLIDFDDCGYGWHMFEMATSLFPKITEPYFDDLVSAYVAGYRSERAFIEEHLEVFPAFLLLRGLTYLGWLMNRAEGLVNRDRIAAQIIEGLCEHIPELLAELTPLQRIGVNTAAWWQARRLG